MNLIDKYKNTSVNNKIVINNVVGAFVVKGASLIISIFTAPAFIHYFNNNEVLGVWFTMLSILTWFLNFDLGIGNGIRNQLTKDIVRNDRQSIETTLSSGFFSILFVTVVLLIVGSIGVSTVNLNKLFNVSSEVISSRTLFVSTIAVFVSIMLRFMLTYVSSVFYALQKSAINNFLAFIVALLQLIFVLVFHFDNVEDALINLSIAYLLISNLPVIIAGIIIFHKRFKDCHICIGFVKRDRVDNIMGIGGVFFACQILYMLIMNTNEFFITKLYGAVNTTEYSFYYKVTSIVAMLVSLAMSPIWSIVTKALEEKNFQWLSKLYSKIKVAALCVVFLQFIIIPILQPVFDIWLGKNFISVNLVTAIAFSCFGSVFAVSTMLSAIVCGLARMKVQFISYLIGAILKLALILFLHSHCSNWNLIVWSNVLVLFPYIVVQIIDLNNFFNNKNTVDGLHETIR